MSTVAAHQITISARTLILALTAFAVAMALAISLPLALRSTHTIFVRPSGGAPVTTNRPPVTGGVTNDSQTRMGDSTPTGPAMTDSQTRMVG